MSFRGFGHLAEEKTVFDSDILIPRMKIYPAESFCHNKAF